MKLATVAALSVFLSTGYAFAGGGAPVPEKPEGGAPSGKAGAVVEESQCKDIWQEASGDQGDLSSAAATPYVVNFEKVDLDGDGKITQAEFLQGCKGGWIQAEASRPAESGGGQTPKQPE
jgi:hypothetical protein